MGSTSKLPYNPDLAPSDFFLFPKLKESIKGFRFGSLEKAKKHDYLVSEKAFRTLKGRDLYVKHRLQKCIDKNGAYVKK